MSDKNNYFSESKIHQFYKDGNVLVTGATGFVGKTLVEKLLRSCPELSKIFVLIRPKRGLNPESRLEKLLKSTLFDRLKAEEKGRELLSKIKVVHGDVTEPILGLSTADYDRLVKEVTVVFHLAASVRFDDKLKDAVTLNVEGTQTVVEFCKRITNLKVFVHVSTAFSNSDRSIIDEIIYKPPLNPSTMIDLCHTFDDKTLEEFCSLMLRYAKRPNTYILTKSMSEWIVSDNSEAFPAGIVRPSIVTSTWREPVPGWIDNIGGVMFLVLGISRGTIRTAFSTDRYDCDVIPVDIVVNTLITAAYQIYNERSNSVRVYNCVSGSLNSISWRELFNLTVKHSRIIPSKYIQWYPGLKFRSNYLVYTVLHFLLENLPAKAFDIVLGLQGNKPIMVSICQKNKRAHDVGCFFSNSTWQFKSNNQNSLATYFNRVDYMEFPTDVALVNWDEYVGNMMTGLRKYLLKDPIDSLPAAKKKLQRFYILHRSIQFVIVFLVVILLVILW